MYIIVNSQQTKNINPFQQHEFEINQFQWNTF